MSKKGISNIYWFVIALAVVVIIGIAWISTEYKPIEYNTETGREQAIIFNSYITAEQVRNYAEEAAKISAFNALKERAVPYDKADCFNVVDPDQFAEETFTGFINMYMEELPLENQYSDVFPTLYGRFFWENNVIHPLLEEEAASRLTRQNGGKELLIEGSPNGDIQVWNSRYYFIYSANGAIKVTVTCDEYKKYMNIIQAEVIP